MGHVVIGKIKNVVILIMKYVYKTVLMILHPQGKFQVNSLKYDFLFNLLQTNFFADIKYKRCFTIEATEDHGFVTKGLDLLDDETCLGFVDSKKFEKHMMNGKIICAIPHQTPVSWIESIYIKGETPDVNQIIINEKVN